MQLPLVTILAISYNQEKYVIDTLNSIKAQTYSNIQLIIADDGSKDNTKQLIREWVPENWPDAVFLDHPVNMGVTKNLNSGLPYIKGVYYQFIGCEDLMMPDKIEKQVTIFEQHPEVGVVYSDMYRMDEEGMLDSKTHYQRTGKYNVPVSGMVYEKMLERCFIATPTALIKSEILFDIGGDNEKLEVNDFDFWMRASKKYLFLYHLDITMKYRLVSTSISAKGNLFHYKNGFLLYYFNYDNRKAYRKIFNSRMFFSIQNLHHLKFKKTSLFSLKAFLKSGDIRFLYFTFLSAGLIFKGKS